MSEKETIRRVKEKHGVFDTIQNILTGGYGTKFCGNCGEKLSQ